MRTRYFISLPEPGKARGDEAWSFKSHSAEGFAEELQSALRGTSLFQSWLVVQDDPDAIDPALADTDPEAQVTGKMDDLHIDLEVLTRLSGDVLKHRLRLLAGSHWQLRDVRAG
ncbi:hypothetical protein CO615_03660 [Lysobacteraceae bacterium NML75-0749]|nr:hypothetical protein CO615_03660 [Xanthomonadaceae bacterium NML75-0749]PJK04531.1 hypothetical protein CO609_05860 [Xanthomonadaceae bacterium NML91-0268]